MNDTKFNELYNRILNGDKSNIKFNDICDFVERLGFEKRKQDGTSHIIYGMKGIIDIINLQNMNGNAKPYQVNQVKKIIQKYRLGGNDNDN